MCHSSHFDKTCRYLGYEPSVIIGLKSDRGYVSWHDFIYGKIHIQVAIIIIIKKGSHSGMGSIIQAIFGGHFFKMRTPFLSVPWLMYKRFCLLSGFFVNVVQTYISIHPSLLISTTATPLPHLPSPVTPAASVTSLNLKSPLFRYNLLETTLPVSKYPASHHY